MKGRTISLVIALILVNYLVFSAIYSLWGSPRPAQPTPTRTPKPTYTRGAEAKLLFVTATATERPEPTATDTPLPVTPTHTPTSVPTQPPATSTVAPAATKAATLAATAVATTVPTAPPAPTNTPTVASVTATATRAPAPAGTSFIHTVVAGESLSLIAQRYGVSIESIVEANGLKSANQVFIGQKLIIPSPRPTPTAGAGQRTHTVKAGEVLSTIAAFYGVTMDAIMKANNITNADLIYAGQVLIIP
jgi:LysM repeat protein